MFTAATLDEHLPELTAGIVQRLHFESPEVATNLEPPRLRVVKGVPGGLNSFCVPTAEGAMILVGGGLYALFHQYTAAAATFFLPSQPGGVRPSEAWHDACAALATTLDWACSPAETAVYPTITLSAQQTIAARAFGDYTYRFALCHEVAHVALGHVEKGAETVRRVGSEDVAVYRASQEDETEADRVGLEFQVNSLPQPSQLVTALASSVYFLYTARLLDAKLMLLADLIDYEEWKIRYSHPPSLARIAEVARAAQALHRGAGPGLLQVHEGLSSLNEEVWHRANEQQEEVTAAVDALVNESAPKEALIQEFHRSPLGVLKGLETAGLAKAKIAVANRLATHLPSEFQEFRRQSKVERARSASGQSPRE